MDVYGQYLDAWRALRATHAEVGKCYARVVTAIQRGAIVLGHVYGDWKLESIWAAGPQAWRPRPIREYCVIETLTGASSEQQSPGELDSALPHELLTCYAELYQREAELSSVETAAYNMLIAAHLRGEITEGLISRDSKAVQTGYADVVGRARCYVLKPAIEPVKRRKS